MYREQTRVVQIGNEKIGGGNPVLIQSMTQHKNRGCGSNSGADPRSWRRRAVRLSGCAVPTMEAAAAIREIKKQIHIPLVADIHFDYRLAIAAIENGADKIRINPGNIGCQRAGTGRGG